MGNSSRRTRLFAWLFALTLVVGASWALVRADVFGWRAVAGLREALTQRGRVAVLADEGDSLLLFQAPRTTLVAAASVPGLVDALEQKDGTRVASVLNREGIAALLVAPSAKPREGSVHAQLARYQHVDGLRGLYVARRASLYAVDPVASFGELEQRALAGVARGLLAGARVPRIDSFPASLRRVLPVEVMVLLREGGKPRLWRSARGSSLARALLTAGTVARQRWAEREQAMGGPLSRALPKLRVEVALLSDDGTLGERDAAFIDTAIGEGYGVGYERKGAWRYLLPDATRERGDGHPSRAYAALLEDDGLPQTALEAPELRLYRLLVRTLAVSEPEPLADDGLSDVRAPGDILPDDVTKR